MPERQLGWAVVGCGWVARDYVIPAIHAAANGRVRAFDHNLMRGHRNRL